METANFRKSTLSNVWISERAHRGSSPQRGSAQMRGFFPTAERSKTSNPRSDKQGGSPMAFAGGANTVFTGGRFRKGPELA